MPNLGTIVPKKGIIVASVTLLAAVGAYEGRSLIPYDDVAGVQTYCDGVTDPPPIPGHVYTNQECNALKLRAVTQHGTELLACIKVPITQGMYEALTSWAYNVGTGAACRSTAIRRLNAGQYKAACDELLRWTRIGGQVSKGLTNRRKSEHALCIKALPDGRSP